MMLSTWTKILPLFIIQWLVRKYCMRLYIKQDYYATVYEDVLIRVKKGNFSEENCS
jgi:hypothetical protein